MPQKISKSSSKCEVWTIWTEGVEIVHNVNNFDGVYNKNFPTLIMFIFEKNPKNLQKPVEYSPTDGMDKN